MLQGDFLFVFSVSFEVYALLMWEEVDWIFVMVFVFVIIIVTDYWVLMRAL